ncbi:MAG TPA: mechanosensitive ion channel domain-containing protein [Candidatus Nanoarchaeia archaeon]|nr:mechanosensitive ion channel domain-containing protein [Candidatus Nanoarchaeia archaeon]
MVDAININSTITDLIIAIFILLIGIFIGRAISNLTKKVILEFEIDKLIKKGIGLRLSIELLIPAIVKYVIYITSIIFAINQLNFAENIYIILLSILAFSIVLMMLLALKDSLQNISAGSSIIKKGLIKKGENIKIGNIEGKVESIDLSETKIITKDKETLFIPNSYFKNNILLKKKDTNTK